VRTILRGLLVAPVERHLVWPGCWTVTWSATATQNDTSAPSVERVSMIHLIWRGTQEHIQESVHIGVITVRSPSPRGVRWKVTAWRFTASTISTSTNSGDLRSTSARTVATRQRNRRHTTCTWKPSTRTRRPFSSSTTRGTSSSTPLRTSPGTRWCSRVDLLPRAHKSINRSVSKVLWYFRSALHLLYLSIRYILLYVS